MTFETEKFEPISQFTRYTHCCNQLNDKVSIRVQFNPVLKIQTVSIKSITNCTHHDNMTLSLIRIIKYKSINENIFPSALYSYNHSNLYKRVRPSVEQLHFRQTTESNFPIIILDGRAVAACHFGVMIESSL